MKKMPWEIKPLSLSGQNKKHKREPVALSQKKEVLARQKSKCNICHLPLNPIRIHFDHIQEVYKGGKSTVRNLQALCLNCHADKTQKERLQRTERNKKKARSNESNNYYLNRVDKILGL